jgi:hypothetical protein
MHRLREGVPLETYQPPVFTELLVQPDAIEFIAPSPNVSGNIIKAHSYIRLARDRVPVYAPARLSFAGGAYYSQGGSLIYKLEFLAACTHLMYLDHLTEAVPAIVKALPAEPMGDTPFVAASNEVEFEAGELLGYAGEHGEGGLDFGLLNGLYEAPVVNLERYRQSYGGFLQGVCAFDSFVATHRLVYRALFGTVGGKRVPGGQCGDIGVDIHGALSGAWFLDGTPSDAFSDRLAVVRDIDGSVRAGGVAGLGDHSATGPDPTLTDSACYAHETTWYWLWLDDTDGDTLHAAAGQGACPTERPTGGAVYRR